MFNKFTSSFSLSLLIICMVVVVSYFLTPNPPISEELKIVPDKSARIGKN